jgi:DNA helicase IV
LTSHPELETEQAYIDHAYRCLEEARQSATRLESMVEVGRGGTEQARFERDVIWDTVAHRLKELELGDSSLVFGRIDTDPGDGTAGDAFYIGRVAVSDEHRDPVVIDWRAPVAEPFYRATGRQPMGLARRRHFATRGRTVLGIEDELFGEAATSMLGVAPASSNGRITGHGALIAALETTRTGRLTDIVATIQGEQDEIIRSELPGILVVQGGPGTGKTVVALHRAAYLLYTHRDRLARRGVLVVGPNATFLRYIGQVLPSLGETSVVLSTVGRLHPGLDARRVEPAAVAEVKGRADMAAVLAAAVRDRQQVPRRPVHLVVEQQRVRLDRDVANTARTRARRSRKPHNEARRIFRKEVVRLLAEQVARTLGGRRLLDPGDLADIREELDDSPELSRELDVLWPTLSPEQLLTELFADPRRLNTVARRLPPADRALLARPRRARGTALDPGGRPAARRGRGAAR